MNRILFTAKINRFEELAFVENIIPFFNHKPNYNFLPKVVLEKKKRK